MRTLLTLLCLLAAGCDGLFSTVTTVSGTVVNTDTGQPAAGVPVAVTGPPRREWIPELVASTFTRPDGTYSLKAVDGGERLTVECNSAVAPGYVLGAFCNAALLKIGTHNEVNLRYTPNNPARRVAPLPR